jgi:hypothetical protein
MEYSIETRNTMLTKRVMRRIYFLWAIRSLLHPTALKALIAGVFFWNSTKYVSYVDVLTNMVSIGDMSAGYEFVKGAMFHAHPMTLVLLSSVAWLSTWVVADALFQKQKSWF